MITITCNSIKDSIAQRQKYISFKSVLVEVRRKIHHTQSDYLKRPRFPKSLALLDLLNL